LCIFQGVIFSIFYHNGHDKICSASDDRSIIVYQVHGQKPSTSGERTVEEWRQATMQAVLRVFGHAGRVWDVVLLSQVFVSVGEVSESLLQAFAQNLLTWSLVTQNDQIS
jgi:hypothetical protein